MAKAVYEYPEDVSLRGAARSVIDACFSRMMENEPGTRDGARQKQPTPEQVEALHDMRVGSRRLRAALSVFARVFPREDLQEIEKEVKAITDALGGVRDLDVQLEYLRELHDSLPENEAYGIGRLIARQTERRKEERKRLRKALERLEESKFEKRFRRILDRALPASGTPESRGGKEA
jgi:Uncharacterized conserved protein